jgi:predicted GNAT family acetyltransferase
VKVFEHTTAESLRNVASETLSRDPANNTGTLSTLQRLQRSGAAHDERFLAIHDDHGLFLGSFIRVETQHCFLSSMPNPAAHALGVHVAATDASPSPLTLRGAVGTVATVDAFVRGIGRTATPYVSLMLYRHAGEIVAGDSLGTARLANEADAQHVAAMLDAFDAELSMIKGSALNTERAAQRIQDQEILVWQLDGQVVAMAGTNPLPMQSARIGPVYTQPSHRGRGIAQALTAAVTRHAQRDGDCTVFLFTDAANPASNKAYQRIGFEHIADHTNVLFEN